MKTAGKYLLGFFFSKQSWRVVAGFLIFGFVFLEIELFLRPHGLVETFVCITCFICLLTGAFLALIKALKSENSHVKVSEF